MILVSIIAGCLVKMDIEKEVVKLEEEIKKLKSSQTIGQSNSYKYLIAGDIAENWVVGSVGEIFKTIKFTSNARAFPHASIVINSARIGNTDVSQYITWYSYSDPFIVQRAKENLFLSYVVAYFFNRNYANTTINVNYSIYADTTGTIN